MAYVQKTTPPPNRILSFSLKNFAGGLNNNSQQLEINQAENLINMKFADETIMEKRYGTTSYDTLQIKDVNGVAEEVNFIDEFRPYQDTDRLIRATSKQVYVNSTKVIDITGQMQGVNFSGKYFFVDGSKLNIYGKFPQASVSPHIEVIGTPVNDYIVMQMVNPPSGFTPLGTGYTKGVHKYNYDTRTAWYEPCQAEIDDTHKGSNVLPENPKYVTVRKGRLYVSGSNKDNDNVFITDVRNPYYFAVYLPMQLPPNSDKVVGLYVYDDAVIVGRREDVYAIHGETNNPNLGHPLFELRKINTHTGFANQNAVDIAHNHLFFLGNDGNAYSLSSTHLAEKTVSTQIISRQIDLFKNPINLTKQDIRTASSIFFDDEWLITIKDKVLVYSYRHRAWTMYNQFSARSFYNLNDTLIWGRSDGFTGTWGTDFFDFNKPFRAFWESKYFDMDESSYFKQFREFFIIGHTYKEYKSDVWVTFQIDFEDVKEIHRIKNQIAIFGRAKWGDRFINRNTVASLPFILGRRGRALKFIISNGYFEHTQVATYADLENVPEKFEGMLVYVTGESAYYLYQDFTWVKQETSDLNQRMKLYQINGDYELRGKR